MSAFTAGGSDANAGAARYIDARSGKCLRCDGADALAMGLVDDPVGQGQLASAPRLGDYNKDWSVCRRPKRSPMNYALVGDGQFEPVPD